MHIQIEVVKPPIQGHQTTPAVFQTSSSQTSVCMYVCIHICMCIYIYIERERYVCMCIYIYIYTHMCVYI